MSVSAPEQTDIFTEFAPTLNIPAFDGASTDYKNKHRAALLGDADFLAINELLLLQARCRHLARNNDIVSAAEDKFVIKLGAVKIRWKTLNGQKHDLMQELWDEFYSNPSVDGKGNGDTLQAVWNRERHQVGEALERMLIITKGNSNRVKLKLQSIPSEYLDISYMGNLDIKESQRPLGTTRYGITFENNKPSIYHFFKDGYFGIAPINQTSFERVKVSARDILHIFERKRSGQWRGIPVSAPILSLLYDIIDLRDATVSKQIASAAISWIIEQGGNIPLNAIGSVRTASTTSDIDTRKKIIFTANGGSVQYTNPGDRFNLVQSADVGNNLLGLYKSCLQNISSAYGLPYYMLSADTDQLDFASIRGILIELRNKLEYIHHFINIPDGLQPLTDRFKEIASTRYAVADAYPSYIFPRYYGMDELKDTQGDVLEVQAGFATSQQKREERHTTLEEVQEGITIDTELGKNGLLDVNSGGNKLTNNSAEATSQSTSK